MKKKLETKYYFVKDSPDKKRCEADKADKAELLLESYQLHTDTETIGKLLNERNYLQLGQCCKAHAETCVEKLKQLNKTKQNSSKGDKEREREGAGE